MIVVCAGMYRSASTWLYNAVRILLMESGISDLAAGWVTEKEKLLASENSVIKIHEFDSDLASRGVVLTSHRDLRDILASIERKFGKNFSLDILNETVESHGQWAKFAKFDLRYEDLLVDKIGQLKRIASVLPLPVGAASQLSYESIFRQIEEQHPSADRMTPTGHDSLNLLHANHITDGRYGSWKGFVPTEIIQNLEERFGAWLISMGYDLPGD